MIDTHATMRPIPDRRRLDRACMKLAWLLPRRLVMWCYIRVVAAATTNAYGSTNPSELPAMEALKRWSPPVCGEYPAVGDVS